MTSSYLNRSRLSRLEQHLVEALYPLAMSSCDHPPNGVMQRDWAEAVNAARVALEDAMRASRPVEAQEEA